MFFFFFIEDLDNAKRIHFHSLAIVLPLLLKRASIDRSIDRFTSTNQPRRVGEELLFETKERFTSPIHLREFSLFCHEGSNYHGWRLQMHDHPPWDTLETDDTSRARSHFATSLPIVTDLLRLVYIRRAIKLRSNYAVDDWQLVRGDPLTIPVQQDPQRRLVETRTDSLRHAFCFELLSFVMLSFSMISSFFFFSSPSSIVHRFVTFKRRRFAAWVKSSIRCVSVDDIRGGSSLENGEKQIGNLRRSWSETRLRKRVNRAFATKHRPNRLGGKFIQADVETTRRGLPRAKPGRVKSAERKRRRTSREARFPRVKSSQLLRVSHRYKER